MKQFRLFLQTVVFAALALSMSLQANISPLAFNGIFKCFKPGYEMYAPNLGCAALQTGIVNALRFYTTQPGGHDADGRRLWINDQAPADDPVAALVLMLFPSPAGNLTAMTSHPENIGRDLTVRHVAQLLNLCAHIRAAVPHMGGNRFGNDATKCLKRLQAAAYKKSENKNVNNNYFSRFFEFQYDPKDPKYKLRSLLFSDQGRKLIVALCKIIEHEERTTGKKFYPKYQAEQLLNAFFCLKFGKDDIPELLENLDDSLVDHEQLIDSCLIDGDDIKCVARKDINNISLDDLWVVQNKDLIDQVIPYPRGCKPINNGLASGYDRTKNELILTQEFPDCTETTIRHLCNLVLFHKEGSFKLEKALSQLSNSSITNLSQYLEAFYQLQSPDKSNSGERSIRDAWCKVVGNLGKPVRYRSKSVRTNTNNDTEVDSGIINIIRVLNIIFNLGLDPEPVYEKDQQFVEKITEWAHSGLQKLFEIISPEKVVDIQISEVRAFRAFGNYENDCSGTINVAVNQDFKFTMSVGSGHAQFDCIDIISPVIDQTHLNQISDRFQFINTIGESIFLLDTKTKEQAITPLYRLFKQGVRDSAQIIDTLKILLEMTQNNEISSALSVQILKNLLHNFLWQDNQIRQKIGPLLKKWTHFAFQTNNQAIKNALQDEVKSVQYDLLCQDFNNNPDDLLDFFHQAQSLFYSGYNDVSFFSLLRKHQSIKAIDLSNSTIKELNISGDICPSLENIYLINTFQFKSLKISGTLKNLKSIDLTFSGIAKLEISGICPNLEILDLKKKNQLKIFKISGSFENLKTIDLSISAISELEISGDICPSLENVYLINTFQLKSLKLSGTLKNLKTIVISQAAISELDISADICPRLESLYLYNTKQLKSLKLSGTLQNLKNIRLRQLAIEELEVSGNTCPNLEELNLECMSQLKNFKLSGTLKNLKTIILSQAAIPDLEISADICPSLETLYLSNTSQLKSLKLSGSLENLKTIYLWESGITDLEISGNTFPNLEKLDLSYTSQLKSLTLLGSLQNLKSIGLSESAIEEVKIFRDCCPNLQSNDPRIKIIDHKRKDRDEEIDNQELPDAKKQCLSDIREN